VRKAVVGGIAQAVYEVAYIGVLAASKPHSPMRQVFIVLLLLASVSARSQPVLAGTYKDQFGGSIIFKPNGTFEYWWGFYFPSSWNVGFWQQQKDTVFLHITSIYDTIQVGVVGGVVKDLLVLSDDQKPNLWTDYLSFLPSNIEQGRHPVPERLVFKRRYLYLLGKNGLLINRKERNALTGKKAKPWYEPVRTL
jgi:hypothetical protein